MNKCIAIIKTGKRKGDICGATKKIIDIVDGKEIPHCNRHKIKENNEKINTDNVLSEMVNKSLVIEDNNYIEKEENNDDAKNILYKLDKQLDDLFNEYGL